MMVVAIVFALYSILWGLAPFDTLNFPARLILDLADWPLDNYSAPLTSNTKFLSAIGAGLLGAISVFLGCLVVPAIREGNETVLRTTILAMSTWYVIDGIGSIASGVASNLIFNSVYLALVIVPILWKDTEEEARA